MAAGDDRTKYLGGSDAASVLGVSPWRSGYRLWSEKTGADPIEDLSLKSWIEWGNRLESLVAEAFAEKRQAKLRVERRFLVHAKHSFLGGHIDRRILNQNAFLECKTSNAFDYRQWGSEEAAHDGVPPHYLAQCDHYLAVGDFEHCYLAVLIGGNVFRAYHIERNEKREQRLLAAEIEFWDLVKNDIPPPIRSEADARHRWRIAQEGTALPVDAATKQLVVTLAQVHERKKTAEEEEKALRNQLFPVFEDKEALSFNGERIASFTCFPRNEFDQKAFEKKHPKLAAKFRKSIPTKRLNLLI